MPHPIPGSSEEDATMDSTVSSLSRRRNQLLRSRPAAIAAAAVLVLGVGTTAAATGAFTPRVPAANVGGFDNLESEAPESEAPESEAPEATDAPESEAPEATDATEATDAPEA